MELKNPSPVFQLNDLSGHHRFRLLADHLTHLEFLDKKKNQKLSMHPVEIVLNNLYKKFSLEDVLRLGFICGQLAQD